MPSLLVLNVTTPLVPEEIRDFCAGKRAVLVVEEGQPEFIEQEIATLLRRQDVGTPIHGKDLLVMAGEYTVEVIARGLALPSPSGMRPTCRSPAAGRGSTRLPRGATAVARGAGASRCRRGRRSSASAAPSGRCSPR